MLRHMRCIVMTWLIIVLVVTGCASPPTVAPAPSDASQAPNGRSSPTPEQHADLTVTDSLGRTVTLAGPAQRIVSLAPALTEILFAVGAGDSVVGVTSYCNYPPEAQEREQIGSYSAEMISIESIIALEPDLVLADGDVHRRVIETLEPLGVSVVALDPENMDEVYAAIEQVGYLAGLEEKARAVSGEMRARIDAVAGIAETIPEDEQLVVYWQVWDEPLMTAGASTFVGQLLDLAGGANAFADLAESYPQISAEEVIQRDPDVIMGPDSHGDKLTVEVFEQRPGWGGITAVRNGRVHLIDADIVSRAGPRLADALEAVAQALYPEHFE